MRRRVVVLVLVSICLAPPIVCAGFLYLRQPSEGLKGRLYQVHVGMTRDKLLEIMGKPPDQEQFFRGPVLTWNGWDGPYYRAVVCLDGATGRVTSRRIEYYKHERTFIDRWVPQCVYEFPEPPACLDGLWPQ